MCNTEMGSEVHRVVYNKFYVDELYELILLKPFRWTANVLYEVVDRFLIDGIFVNGSAYIINSIGRFARFLQNGQVQRYMVAMVVGGALIFYWSSDPKVNFEYRQLEGYEVEFRPDVGDGLDSKGALIEFDVDGDGEADFSEKYDPRSKMVVKYRFGGPGKNYKVTMKITDAAFGESYSVTKNVVVKEVSKGGAQ